MSRSPATQLLDQELAERIATLRFQATRAVDGVRSGVHKSPHRGASMIFAEHRDYRPGDDPRLLDWRAYARNDRYTIKRFEQETHVRASLLLDLSASMAFDADRPETRKSTYAATLLAALALILLGQGDAVGVYAFDDQLRQSLPPRNRPDHLDAVLSILALPAATRQTSSRTSLRSMLTALGEHLGRRGLVVLASDLIDLETDALGPLSHYAALGHEVMVFHTLHPQELEFPFRGSTRFEDSETAEVLETDATAVRIEYQRELAAFMENCKQRCVAAGARYCLARTDTPVERVIAEIILTRRAAGWA